MPSATVAVTEPVVAFAFSLVLVLTVSTAPAVRVTVPLINVDAGEVFVPLALIVKLSPVET